MAPESDIAVVQPLGDGCLRADLLQSTALKATVWYQAMVRRWNVVGAIGAERDRWSERAAMAVCALLVLIIVWLCARLFWSLLATPATPVGSVASSATAVAGVPTVSLAKWHLFGGAISTTSGN
ncbi:MAG: hypothetical protein ABI650_01530, partial [Dokdonella sp.]